MTKIFLFLAASMVLLVSCNHISGKSVQGSGNVVSDNRPVGEFSEILNSGSFNVTLSPGTTHTVRVEADENLHDYINVSVQNNKLHISSKEGYSVKSSNPITVYVTAPSLRAVRLHGSGNISGDSSIDGGDKMEIESSGSGDVSMKVKASEVQIHLAGSGNMTISGNAESVNGQIAGSGNIKAGELRSAKTSISIAGSGNAEVAASEKLSADIAGSGNVEYWGNPVVNSHIAGSGRVVQH